MAQGSGALTLDSFCKRLKHECLVLTDRPALVGATIFVNVESLRKDHWRGLRMIVIVDNLATQEERPIKQKVKHQTLNKEQIIS